MQHARFCKTADGGKSPFWWSVMNLRHKARRCFLGFARMLQVRELLFSLQRNVPNIYSCSGAHVVKRMGNRQRWLKCSAGAARTGSMRQIEIREGASCWSYPRNRPGRKRSDPGRPEQRSTGALPLYGLRAAELQCVRESPQPAQIPISPVTVVKPQGCILSPRFVLKT